MSLDTYVTQPAKKPGYSTHSQPVDTTPRYVRTDMEILYGFAWGAAAVGATVGSFFLAPWAPMVVGGLVGGLGSWFLDKKGAFETRYKDINKKKREQYQELSESVQTKKSEIELKIQEAKGYRSQATELSKRIASGLELLKQEGYDSDITEKVKEGIASLEKLYANHGDLLQKRTHEVIEKSKRYLAVYGSEDELGSQGSHQQEEVEEKIFEIPPGASGYTLNDFFAEFQSAKEKNQGVQGRTIDDLLSLESAAAFKNEQTLGVQTDPKKSGARLYKILDALATLDNKSELVRLFSETNYEGDRARAVRSMCGVHSSAFAKALLDAGITDYTRRIHDIYRVLEGLTHYLPAVSADETVVDKPAVVPKGVGPEGETDGYKENGQEAPPEEERLKKERVQRHLAVIRASREIRES